MSQEDSFLAQFGFEDPRAQLVVLAVITFVVWALESLFEYLHGVEWRNLAQTVQHELRIDAYRHVQDLEIAYHEQQSTGELMAVLNDDVNQLERFLDNGANTMLQTATATILIGITFLVLVPGVAWLAFLPIPFIVYGSIRFQRRMETRYAAVREQAGGAQHPAGQQPRRDRDHQGVQRPGARGGPDLRGERPLPQRQPARHPAQRRLLAADPGGGAHRLHVDADLRRLPRPRRPARGGQLLGARLHHPAAAVAPDRARRDPRPVPAGDGVHDPHPQRARHRPGDAQRHRAAAPPPGAVAFDQVRSPTRTDHG